MSIRTIPSSKPCRRFPDLVAAAVSDGQEALALTDNGNLYGAIEFYMECKAKGVKPILGVDFFVAARTRNDKEHRVDDRSSRLVLLARNEVGYRNLMLLVSRSHLEGFYYRPRVDRELIEEYKEGLVAILPSFSGEHARALKEDARDRALETLAWYKKTFGDYCFVEITRHPKMDGHEEAMQQIILLARETGLPLVAAHDTYYLKPEDALARELVNKIRTGSTLNRDFAESAHDFSFITKARAHELFADLPEALTNVDRIVKMCDLELKLGRWVFPDFPIPPGRTAEQELRALVEKGFTDRGVPPTKENRERVEYELGVIGKKGYTPYFLVVSDLLRHAREKGILTNTRGSAAGSLVSYLAGITTVNPLVYQLPFERFLNPERPSPPDIDMDVADNRRDAAHRLRARKIWRRTRSRR
jgi:DNA polymerase-3 subunit alpha